MIQTREEERSCVNMVWKKFNLVIQHGLIKLPKGFKTNKMILEPAIHMFGYL